MFAVVQSVGNTLVVSDVLNMTDSGVLILFANSLQTNVGHRHCKFGSLKKIIRSDISAFVQGHYQVHYQA